MSTCSIVIGSYAFLITNIAHSQNQTCTIASAGLCTTTTTDLPTYSPNTNATIYTNPPSIVPTQSPTLEPSYFPQSPSMAPFNLIYLTSPKRNNTTNNPALTTKFVASLDSSTSSHFLCISNTITLCTIIISISFSCACFIIACILSICCCRRKAKKHKKSIDDENEIDNLPPLPLSMHGTISGEGIQRRNNELMPGDIGGESQSEIVNDLDVKIFDVAGKNPNSHPANHHIRLPSDTQYTQYTATNDRRSQIRLHVSMPTNTTADFADFTKLRHIKSEETNVSDLFEKYDEDENETIRASIGLCIHSRAVSKNSDQDIVTPGNSDIGDIVMNVYGDKEQDEDSLMKEIEDMIRNDSSLSSAGIETPTPVPGGGTKRAWL